MADMTYGKTQPTSGRYAGFLFIAICGLWLRFHKSDTSPVPLFRNMDWPIGMLLFLSLGVNFYLVVLSHIPLLSTVERVPSRFIIMPLLFLSVIACVRLQALVDRQTGGRGLRIAVFLALLHNTYLLTMHSWIWQNKKMEALFADPSALISTRLASGDTPAYESAVMVSLLTSFVAIVSWLYLMWRIRASVATDTA